MSIAGTAACGGELPSGLCVSAGSAGERGAVLAVLSVGDAVGFAGAASVASCAEAAFCKSSTGKAGVTRPFVDAVMVRFAADGLVCVGGVSTGVLRTIAAAIGCAGLAAACAWPAATAAALRSVPLLLMPVSPVMPVLRVSPLLSVDNVFDAELGVAGC